MTTAMRATRWSAWVVSLAAVTGGADAAAPAVQLRAELKASLVRLKPATAAHAAAVSQQLGAAARSGLAAQQARVAARLPLAVELKLAAAQP